MKFRIDIGGCHIDVESHPFIKNCIAPALKLMSALSSYLTLYYKVSYINLHRNVNFATNENALFKYQ
jgi:formate-dependent nitrite reductase membrane component NrfD